jgi:hypothetical protein
MGAGQKQCKKAGLKPMRRYATIRPDGRELKQLTRSPGNDARGHQTEI